MKRLHVTNGDLAADLLRAWDCEATVLPWRDVLHEGPVRLHAERSRFLEERASFIASCGWENYDVVLSAFRERDAVLTRGGTGEIHLWFEPDLYDQLQLIEICSLLDERPPPVLSLVQADTYLTGLGPEQLSVLFDGAREIDGAMRGLAREAFSAFAGADPRGVGHIQSRMCAAGTESPLRYLAGALRRALQELPWTTDGLSRSERQLLECCAGGEADCDELYRRHQAKEEWVFCGDSTWWMQLTRLGRCAGGALLALRSDDCSNVPVPDRPEWSLKAKLTERGRAVLRGSETLGPAGTGPRWLGGYRVGSPPSAAQDGSLVWDEAAGAVVSRARK